MSRRRTRSLHNAYFIVNDGSYYELMFGNPKTAVGISTGKTASSVKALLRQAPHDVAIYRTFLYRTDGKEGVQVLQRRKAMRASEREGVRLRQHAQKQRLSR